LNLEPLSPSVDFVPATEIPIRAGAKKPQKAIKVSHKKAIREPNTTPRSNQIESPLIPQREKAHDIPVPILKSPQTDPPRTKASTNMPLLQRSSSEKVQLPSFKRSPKTTSPAPLKRPGEPHSPAGEPSTKKPRLDPPNSSPSADTFKEVASIEGINVKAMHLKGSLDALSLTEMKSFLKKQGLATSGKKPDLLKRIQSHFLDEEE